MSGSDDPYVYLGTKTLKNLLGIIDPTRLDETERLLVTQRVAEGIPKGSFDLVHLQAIHRHLFQDIYEWAGNPYRRDQQGCPAVPVPPVHPHRHE